MTNKLETPLDELEDEVMRQLEKIDNPYKVYSVIFPYQVRFTLEDDNHNTEIIINTKSEEFYTAKDVEEVEFQKELSDNYSGYAFIKRIIKYAENQLPYVDVEDAQLTYTGRPEVSEMTEDQLSTFEGELMDSINDR
jgi:hypothetical protein